MMKLQSHTNNQVTRHTTQSACNFNIKTHTTGSNAIFGNQVIIFCVISFLATSILALLL
jgi:hypothetical protein